MIHRTAQRTTLPSLLIHGGALALFLLLFARAFAFDGILAYAAGIAYAAYDTVLLGFVAIMTRDLIRPASAFAPAPVPVPVPAGLAAGAPTVAVLIAAYNEALGLPATIDALLSQTPPPDEIIVADDGSSDATALALAPYIADHAVRWLRLAHAGKAWALNAGLAEVRSEVFVTVDADTLLHPGALAAMRAAFAREPELVAASGVLLPALAPGAGLGARLLHRFQAYEYVRNFLSRYAWMRADGLLLISGAFAGLRTEAVRAVGGFDPSCLVEDYELIHRLRRHGTDIGQHWTARVLGEAVASTDTPATLLAFLRQRRRWFGGFLQTQLRYREMVGQARYGAVGLAMMPVKALDTLQPIYGLTALGVLLCALMSGHAGVAFGAGTVITVKIGIDLVFHAWSVLLFQRWLGDPAGVSVSGALMAALVEPFCFQPLRHLGAALGWITFLSGRKSWYAPVRSAVGTPSALAPSALISSASRGMP